MFPRGKIKTGRKIKGQRGEFILSSLVRSEIFFSLFKEREKKKRGTLKEPQGEGVTV